MSVPEQDMQDLTGLEGADECSLASHTPDWLMTLLHLIAPCGEQ